jgi:hypothetical protein
VKLRPSFLDIHPVYHGLLYQENAAETWCTIAMLVLMKVAVRQRNLLREASAWYKRGDQEWSLMLSCPG